MLNHQEAHYQAQKCALYSNFICIRLLNIVLLIQNPIQCEKHYFEKYHDTLGVTTQMCRDSRSKATGLQKALLHTSETSRM